MSSKTELNPEVVKSAMDSLGMFKEKTLGNLSEYEEQFLNETIRDLKLVCKAENKKE